MNVAPRAPAVVAGSPQRCGRSGVLRRLLIIAVSTGAAIAQTGSPPSLATYKQMSLAQLMDVEVTSVSRRVEKLSGAASAIQVATGDDIRRAGIHSLPAALRLLSNLEVAQVDSRQWAITARGFNNTLANKMLVLMDGRTLYTPLFAGVFWDVQDTLLEDVDRIEAISGPGATQWGSNAVNGVISITTKNAKDTQGSLVLGGGGRELRGIGGVRHGGTLAPGMSYRVYAKYFDRDAAVLPDGRDAPDTWHKLQGGFRVDWETPARDLVTLQGDAYDGRIGQASFSDIAVSGGNVIGRWSRPLAENSEIVAQIYFDRTYRRMPGSITEDLAAYDFDFHHRLPLGRSHDIMWGLSYRITHGEIENPATLAFLPPDTRHQWFSGFIQDEIALMGDRLRLTLGTKIEDTPYTGVEHQPSIRAAWTLPRNNTVWAAISRALRTPSRIDRELFAPATPPFTALAGGPNFESEKLIAYELGYRAQPRPELAISLATYFHDYDDLRSVEPPSPGSAAGPVIANGLDGKSYGAELSVDYRLRAEWRLRFGYTEMRVHSAPAPGSLDRQAAGSPALDPNRQLLLHSQLDLPAKTTFDAVLRYVAPIRNHQVPGYTELDARASWHPTDALELAIAGRNLLRPRHAEFGAAAARREIERSVVGTFTWRF